MAKIGVYQPQLTVPIVDAPRVQRTDVSSGLMAAANTMRDIEDGKIARHRATQLNDTEIGMASEFSTIRKETDAANWQDKEALFAKGAAKIREKWVDTQGDDVVKGAAAETYKRLFLNHQEHTTLDARAGERDHNIVQTETALDQYVKDAAAARSDGERQLAQENMRKAVANVIDGGFVDEAKGEKMLRGALSASDLQTASVLIGAEPGAARRLFGDQGAAQKRFPSLDPLQIEQLRDKADREVRSREAEAKANTAQRRAEFAIDAAELVQSDLASRKTTGKAVVETPQHQAILEMGLTPAQREKYAAEAERADMIFKATGDFAKMPAAEMTRALEKLKPKGGEADFAARLTAYNEAAKAARDTLSDRKTDPAAAARDAFPNVRDRWAAYEQNPHSAHLRDAIKANLAAQTSLGIAANVQKPVPAMMALSVAQDILSAPPDQAHKKLQQYATDFGPYWNATFRQMSPWLDANTKVAAVMDDTAMAGLLLSTARQQGDSKESGVARLRKALGVPISGAGSLRMQIGLDDRMRDFRTSASQLPGGGKNADDLTDAAEVLALGLMQSRGMSMGEATERAIKATLDDKYTFGHINGRVFHVQRKLDVDAIERGATQMLSALTADGLSIAVPQGALKKELDAAAVAAIKRNGYWVTNHNASGLILFNERGAPVLKNGRPIGATWSELSRMAAPRSALEKTLVPGAN